MRLYNKKKTVLNLIILFLFFSCNKKDEDIEYYQQSKNKYKVSYHFDNYDSIVYFYRNGKIFKTGKQYKNTNLFGKWNYYNIDGFLSENREFFIIGNDYILNQIWYYNKKGDTIFYPNKKFNAYKQKEFESDIAFDSSIFIRILCHPKKDTIKLFEKISVDIEDATPFWAKNGSECYVILAKEKYNFNSNFSNINEAKFDTIHNLYSIKSNRGQKNATDLKHTIGFNISFKTTGKKVLRGYMMEYWKRKPTIDDSIKYRARKVYFEKIIYVK